MNEVIKKSIFISITLVIVTMISLINLFIRILNNNSLEIIIILMLINQLITYNFGYYYSRFCILNYINENLKSDKDRFNRIIKKYINKK